MKLTESQLKRLIKEEVVKSLKESYMLGDEDNAIAVAEGLIEQLGEIADGRACENLEDSPRVFVTITVEDEVDDSEREVIYHGRPGYIMGDIEYEYYFRDYDDFEIMDTTPNLVVTFDDGEEEELVL